MTPPWCGVFKPDYDVVVIGAGVAGCKAALEASQAGAKVVLLEEHPQVGVPSHCSGVVSLDGLRLIGVDPHQSFSQRPIRGAKFYPPHGEPVEVRKNEPVALIVNRMRFDQFLAKQALSEKVELRTNTRASQFERRERGVLRVVVQQGTVDCSSVIDASGAGSRFPGQAGLEGVDWSQLLPGLQFELVDLPRQGDLVEVFFGSHVAPGFFAWSIPTSETSARVGLASSRGNVKKLLEKLVESHWPNSRVDATKSGSVLVSGPMKKCWAPGFLVAGDAAGQVKQTTGGGIVIGGYCGMLAGRGASKFALAMDENTRPLRDYDSEWKRKFASDLRQMGLARKIFATLSDETLTQLFKVLGEHVGEIEEFANMDFQGKLISRFLRKRRFASLLPHVLADSFKSLIS